MFINYSSCGSYFCSLQFRIWLIRQQVEAYEGRNRQSSPSSQPACLSAGVCSGSSFEWSTRYTRNINKFSLIFTLGKNSFHSPSIVRRGQAVHQSEDESVDDVNHKSEWWFKKTSLTLGLLPRERSWNQVWYSFVTWTKTVLYCYTCQRKTNKLNHKDFRMYFWEFLANLSLLTIFFLLVHLIHRGNFFVFNK